MLKHKNIDRICCIVLAATLALTMCYMGAAATGAIAADSVMGYENRLFDTSVVHTIDIVMDDWEGFLSSCTNEEYVTCAVVIDGESYRNVAIRAKGNTSLSSVQSYGNNRYSFKIEFDHYESGVTYHGLDKLCLNNIIQDKTYLKDYVAYTLMNRMGVAAPLCSFVQIRVNGEEWGLYLAVESVEESFLKRNYGADYGELYKPDSMSMGGGRGNGRDFDMEAFGEQFGEEAAELFESRMPESMGGFSGMDGQMPGMMNGFGGMPEGMTAPGMPGAEGETPEGEASAGAENSFVRGGREKGNMGGMGSSDVMLQYTDDDPASYTNIFSSAKTNVTEEDQRRLIASLKGLSEGEVDGVVDAEAVIRYLVVHNFLCNDDSYTGQMIHNYYLYEEDGALSMIPWDYNLAFGGFAMGGSGSAASVINSPIDSPVSSGTIDSRPIIAWIFSDESYTARYHEVYQELVDDVYAGGWLGQELKRVSELIAPYVERDPTAFFTYEEFRTGAAALIEFCNLRFESISGQLDGTIPSTTDGQYADSSALIDGSGVSLSDLGEFGMGGGFSRGGETGKSSDRGFMRPDAENSLMTAPFPQGQMGTMTPPGGMTGRGMGGEVTQMTPPNGMSGQMPGGMQMPGMMAPAATEEVPAATGMPEEEPAGFEEPMQESGMNALTSDPNRSGQTIRMTAGSAVLLLIALIFVKFYKTNR